MKYNYLKAVKADIIDYIDENMDELMEMQFESREQAVEYLNDELWNCDQVTGSASGSYTFNTWEAEENLCHNLELLREAVLEFGSDENILDNAEACDVTIRCYLLSEAIEAVIDNYEELWEGGEYED